MKKTTKIDQTTVEELTKEQLAALGGAYSSVVSVNVDLLSDVDFAVVDIINPGDAGSLVGKRC